MEKYRCIAYGRATILAECSVDIKSIAASSTKVHITIVVHTKLSVLLGMKATGLLVFCSSLLLNLLIYALENGLIPTTVAIVTSPSGLMKDDSLVLSYIN